LIFENLKCKYDRAIAFARFSLSRMTNNNDDLFPDADTEFDVKPVLSLSSSMPYSRFGVGDDDDEDALRALLLNNNSNNSSSAVPMQSSAEGLFVRESISTTTTAATTAATASTTSAIDLDMLMLQPPPPLLSSTTVHQSTTNVMPKLGVSFGSLPVAAAAPAVGFIPHRDANAPRISIPSSPRVVHTGGVAAPVLDALELDAERLSAAVVHLCTAYVSAAPHERILCVEHARRVASELHVALSRAFGLRRRVVLAELLSRWQRLADRLHASLMHIRLLSDVQVLADGTATNADAIGALVIDEQSALPCAAMSKRQRPEGMIVVRWICSPVAIVAAGGAAMPRRARAVCA
jgi:hypothetical protein